MTTKQEFWAFHKANPSVYKEFEKYTNVAIDRGAKHLSHWLVIGRIRYETAIETNDPDYKINNNYIKPFLLYSLWGIPYWLFRLICPF